jgi:hypothetical protein
VGYPWPWRRDAGADKLPWQPLDDRKGPIGMAVFPARNIDVSNCINSSTASFLPFVRGAAARRCRMA